MEYKSNDFIGQNYERKIELERLTPIGQMYLETYIRVRVNENTIKLVKPSKIKNNERNMF
jgi:hypothetical protein